MKRLIPGLQVQCAIFLPKTNSYGNLGDLVPRFHWCSGCLSCYHHLEFLIRLLIGLIFQDTILDLENNRTHCSRNNSLFSFSAPDWLLPLWARYTTPSLSWPETKSTLHHYLQSVCFYVTFCNTSRDIPWSREKGRIVPVVVLHIRMPSKIPVISSTV